MFPNWAWPHPTSSFNSPVPLVGADPDEPPLVHVCFNRKYLPYVIGSLKQLLLQSTWDTTIDSEIDLQQERVFNLLDLFAQDCPQPVTILLMGEFELLIRQNADNPCLIEASPDNIHWVTFIDLSKCTNFGVQPGTTTSQPAPGGGTQQTCSKLNANSILLLPALVSTGDTIKIDSASGAGWDGGEFDFGPLYRLPNGNQYVGGLDVGLPRVTGTDPVVAANHMSLIAVIGSTPTYLALPIGTAVTVPSGISNAQVYIQVNDSAISNNQGSYDVCATITNNALPFWTHVFDFTTAPGPFGLVSMEGGVYSPTVGWSSTFVSPYQQIQIRLVLPAATYVGMSMDFDSTVSGVNSFIGVVSGTTITGTPAIGHNHLDYAGSLVAGNNIFLQVNGGSGVVGTDGQYVIVRFTISGTGTDPF